MKTIIRVICCLTISLFVVSCNGKQLLSAPTLTATVTSPPTPTLMPSATQTPVPTYTPTEKPTYTLTPSSSDEIYADLLDQVKQGKSDLDFTALRMAYSESSGYDPYGGATKDLMTEAYTAADNKDYDKALELLDQILDKNFLSTDAHLLAYDIYDALNQPDKVDFHYYVLAGITDSIRASGDGKSVATAFKVITIEEEYFMFGWIRIKDESQSLFQEGEHSYDVFEGVDEDTNEKVTYYFNIDKPQAWLTNSLAGIVTP